ncbi:MAG: biotin--protein ligase [Dokdonella sp.]|nr:biotin--protein ligase [Dokdonella sp.]
MHRHGEYKMPGGKLTVVDLQIVDGRLADVVVSGDFFLEPDDALAAIHAAVEGQPAELDESRLAQLIEHATPAHTRMYGVDAQAIARALRRAIDAGRPA